MSTAFISVVTGHPHQDESVQLVRDWCIWSSPYSLLRVAMTYSGIVIQQPILHMKLNITDCSHSKIKSPWGTYHVSLFFCITHLVHPCSWAKTIPGMGLPLLQKCVLWSWSVREHGAVPILRKVSPIFPCSWYLTHQLGQLNPEPFWQYQLCNHAFISRCPHWSCSQGGFCSQEHTKGPEPFICPPKAFLSPLIQPKPITDHSGHKDEGHYEMGHCDGWLWLWCSKISGTGSWENPGSQYHSLAAGPIPAASVLYRWSYLSEDKLGVLWGE